jgi:membrane protein implicated in regulation of membrane protease activity
VSGSPLAVRGLTLLAAGFLGFDGAVLAGIGVWAGRWAPAVAGVVLFVASALVVAFGRRQRRRLDEIAAARRELRDETEELRRLLGR